MYKCKECEKEYDIKPDYCDCGNDEFDIVANLQQNQAGTLNVAEEVPVNKSVPVNDTKKYIENLDKFCPKYTPISVAVFVFCLIFAVIILFIPVKEKEIIQSEAEVVAQKIPTIDKFWNDTVSEMEKITSTEPVTPQAIGQNIQKPALKPIKPPTAAAKPRVETVNKNTASVQKTEKELNKTEAAKKLAEVKKQAEDLQQAMSDKMEYANYKVKLRNTLGQKIDFTKVIGDGDCIISFKIDQYGRLINGAFAKQSSNITLNNAVYNAFMSSRNFTPPPAYYKNETLKLYIKFYNGNFEISLN